LYIDLTARGALARLISASSPSTHKRGTIPPTLPVA
jgi:hypothetical protein